MATQKVDITPSFENLLPQLMEFVRTGNARDYAEKELTKMAVVTDTLNTFGEEKPDATVEEVFEIIQDEFEKKDLTEDDE
jgi:hypothetical protein